MNIPQGNYRPIELLRYAGLFLWFCAGIPLLLMYQIFPEPLETTQYIAWFLLHGLFGMMYWSLMQYLPESTDTPYRVLFLAILTGSALGITAVSQTLLGGILLLIVAVILPWMLSIIPAVSWLIAQYIVLEVTIIRVSDLPFSEATLETSLFLGISLFAFMSSVVAMRQNTARVELRMVNSELRATQALLEENTRIAERVRIARELHDLVGHHLTALTLNLEVVTHLVDGKVLGHVQQAHSLAKLLLADVREVVSEMREGDKVNLAAHHSS